MLLGAWSSAQSFSAQTQLSLLTCSPGKELYAKFGHSAIRARDSLSGRDVVFNYGIFDFDTPNFYTKFLRGKLLYRLAVHDTRGFIEVYRRENREVTEQEIQLTEEERQQALDFLTWNYRPENRQYLYDFFFDNCSTRIRDVLYEELDGRLSLPSEDRPKYTFRQLLDRQLQAYPWPKFGMDLVLGAPADHLADFSDEMFLPEYLSGNLALIQVEQPDTSYQLLKPARLLVDQSPTPVKASFWSPTLAASLFFIVIVLITVLTGPNAQRIFDRFFFIILGLLGAFLLFMWVGTDHYPTKENWNLVWLHPLLLFFPWIIEARKGKWIVLLQIIFLVSLVLSWGHLPQAFNLAFIPIWAAIAVRCARLFLERGKVGLKSGDLYPFSAPR